MNHLPFSIRTNHEDMSSLANYNEDLKYNMKTMRWILRLIGAWPISISSSILVKIAIRIQNVIIYCLIFTTIIPALLHIFLKENNARTIFKLIGPSMNSFTQFIVYSILLYRANYISKSLNIMNWEWNNANTEERQILWSTAKIGKRLVIISVVIMYGGGMSFRTVVPILRGKLLTTPNITIRPLVSPCYLILINEQATPFYEIIFVLQVISGIISYSIQISASGIFSFLGLHVCGQLKILMHKMAGLTDDVNMDDASVQLKLTDIIDHHTKIKGFLNDICTIIEFVCFFETMGGMLLLCIAAFFILTDFHYISSNIVIMITYFTLFSSFIFSMFILCYIGQLIVNEGQKVQLQSITITWYHLPIKKARCLVLVIVVCSNPLRVVAGKMFDMSLATFTDIMKMSFAYLNILRSLE